jgi:hypothetical protein
MAACDIVADGGGQEASSGCRAMLLGDDLLEMLGDVAARWMFPSLNNLNSQADEQTFCAVGGWKAFH